MAGAWRHGLGFQGLGVLLALLPAPLLAARPASPPYESPIIAWRYVVQPGDTFAAIARRMGVSMEALATENRVPLPYLIAQGQVLRRPSPTLAPQPAPPPARRQPPAVRPAAPQRPAPTPAPSHARESGAPRLAWPTSGAIMGRYGVPVAGRRGTRPNDGIDLAALSGTTVHAAAAGRVIFAGTEPERFGQLILIDHGGGWVSAYAYLGQVQVKEGQQVAAHAAIARIGKSGEAKKPTLHFELRRDNVPRDPAPYLPARL